MILNCQDNDIVFLVDVCYYINYMLNDYGLRQSTNPVQRRKNKYFMLFNVILATNYCLVFSLRCRVDTLRPYRENQVPVIFECASFC